ncbi:MAG TPA: TRAP transporter substrate-binding protein DctP [Candidatus Limnocylindria bacterium]|nr:TRAP transporter substrate-binding protein DctP [Candidatus Limnocylindria bacterium]
MKKLACLSVAVAVLTLIAGGPAPAEAQAKPIVWNLPHVAAPTYYHTINLNAFAAKVKEKSGGRMEIRVHPASSLYPQQEILPSLLDGRSEIGPVLSGYLTDVLLELGVLELPFMTSSLEEHRKAQQQLKPFFTEQLGKKGLKMLTAHAWPSQQVFSHEPIRTIADWKGKKIRVYGADTSNITKTLGGVPVNIPFGELYTALDKKTVDGAITSATNAEPMKFFEVSKVINYWFLAGASSEWLVVNQKAWDGLAKDLQQVVLDSLKEVRFEDKEWEDAKAFEERALKRFPEIGMTVVNPSKAEIEKARKLSRAAWDTWLSRSGADGKRGMELALKALGR